MTQTEQLYCLHTLLAADSIPSLTIGDCGGSRWDLHVKRFDHGEESRIIYLIHACVKHSLSNSFARLHIDECGISILHTPGKVVTELGRKTVCTITSAEKGKTHTLLCCVSASGDALPPFMIFPRKRMSDKLKAGSVRGTYFACSISGCVTKELYLEWFKFFIDNIPPTRPVLLIEMGMHRIFLLK